MFKRLTQPLFLRKSLTIRAAAAEEMQLLLDIFNKARLTAGCFRKRQATQTEFEKLTKGEAIHIAEISGRIAGFVSVWELDGFIHHLYVCPSFQGQGIGTALLQRCEQQYGLPLSLRCICNNEQALGFYKRHGWITKGYGTGPEGPWEHLWRKHPPRRYDA